MKQRTDRTSNFVSSAAELFDVADWRAAELGDSFPSEIDDVGLFEDDAIESAISPIIPATNSHKHPAFRAGFPSRFAGIGEAEFVTDAAAMGCPHLGQLAAADETSLLHSGHLINIETPGPRLTIIHELLGVG